MRQVEQGDYSPYRVMIQGDKHWVINPDGSKLNSWRTAEDACDMARLAKSIDLDS